MNKRGQVFLIAAIIFIFAIYSVIIKYNQAQEYAALEDYDALTENYQNEFPKVANKALLNEKNVNDELKEFNQQFIDQAREKDPNYGALYAYKDQEGILHIVNTLTKKTINIEFNNEGTIRRLNDIQLLSGDTESTGNIALEGVGSTDVNTETRRFGANFNNEQSIDLQGITSILLKDPNGATIARINIKDFTTINYVSSCQNLLNDQEDCNTQNGNNRNNVIAATLTTS